MSDLAPPDLAVRRHPLPTSAAAPIDEVSSALVHQPAARFREGTAPREGTAAVGRESDSFIGRLLRTPLLTKLVLLDLVINAVAFLVMQRTPPDYAEQVTLLSLGLVLVLNAGLVAYALRPLRFLEETARRVSRGEFTARTEMPPFTDRNLARIASTLDTLLDRVDTDRRRVRALAAQVVAAADQERAHVARELHDGTAQSLSALDMLLASALAEPGDEQIGARLLGMREIVTEALDEVRALSHSVHPRVLDDLGLAAALEFLARRTRLQLPVEVAVQCQGDRALPQVVSSVLYRVAQEAVHNAVKHGMSSRIRVSLVSMLDTAELEVSDDGVGFDRAEVDASRRGMGLFVMEERVSLVDGAFSIVSAPGEGTVVRAVVPLSAEAR
jgi:signal transduction histidine kinase